MKSKLLTVLFISIGLVSGTLTGQIIIDGDMLDWSGISAADVGAVAEELGDMPNGAEFDLQDLYITHDDTTVFLRIVVDPSATLATQWTTDPGGWPAFQLFIDTNFGDTSGLGYGGFWTVPPDYMIELVEAYHPTEPTTEVSVYYYPYDYDGAFEDWDSVGVAQIAVSDAGNELEIAVPRDVIHAGTDIRPWVYSVRTDDWDNEEYLPNDQAEGDYAINYNFFTGPSVVQMRGTEITTAILIDGDMLDWSAITPADVDEVAEALGDMPNGAEFDLQDMYVTSNDSTVFLRIVVDPSATLATQWTTDPGGWPAFQLFIDSNFGDTSGLGYGGFWTVAPDYMIELVEAYHPTEPTTEVSVYYYPYDYDGAFEDWDSVGVAQIAVSDAGNELEIAVPKAVINAGTDIRPWVYSVRTDDWDNEEYLPDDQAEGNYAINYNFFTGSSVVQMREVVTTAIESPDVTYLPSGFALSQNYPNPFNPTTTITYEIPVAGPVSLVIYDLLGQRVAVLHQDRRNVGRYNTVWNGMNDAGAQVGSGIYLYRLEAPGVVLSRKMVLLK